VWELLNAHESTDDPDWKRPAMLGKPRREVLAVLPVDKGAA